ncbi:MAG: ATP-dependent Clp protease adaptor ClpS [Phycisphaerales bacterium]
MSTEAPPAPVAPAPAVQPPRPKRMPGWSVLLHNDDVNELTFVIRTVSQLVRLNVQDAVTRVVEAEDTGVALLTVTHREHAELLQEQFQSAGLTVTIEPAP